MSSSYYYWLVGAGAWVACLALLAVLLLRRPRPEPEPELVAVAQDIAAFGRTLAEIRSLPEAVTA